MKKIYAPLFVAILFLASCSRAEQPVEEETPQAAAEEAPAIVPGCAEVKFSSEMTEMIEEYLATGAAQTKSDDFNALMTEYGITSLERVFPYAGEYEERTRREGLHQWYKVTFDPNVPVTKAEQSFEDLPGVEECDPIRKIHSDAVFNDPKFTNQWDLYNHGFSDSSKYSEGCDVNVVDVWKYYTTGDPSVIVAVVDGGIDYTHEDLAYNYVGGYNFVDNSSTVLAHDHGTHVAGTIAATNNNGVGVCGIAGGNYAKGKKGVGLLSCQIFRTNSSGQDESASGATAIKYGADHGAVIAQNSWGYTYDKESDAEAATIPSTLKSAIDYFIKYAGCDNSGNQKSDSPMKGGVVIFAASNDAWAYNPIGEYEPVIAVGSVGADYNRAYYSNYGDWVDICAPGGDAKKGPQILSTTPGNTYSGMQGTSMACPHVSGVAALIVSYNGGQGYTADMLTEQLLNGANHTAVKAAQQIGPLVDALGSITYGDKIAPGKVTTYTAEANSNNINFTWTVTADSKSHTAYAYKIFAAKDKTLLDNLDPSAALPSGVVGTTALVGDLETGASMSATLSGLDFETDYYVAIVGYSYSLCYSSLSSIKSVKTQANNPPVISWDEDSNFTVKSHETINYDLSIYDPDNHSIKVVFTPGSSAATLTESEFGYVLAISGKNADAGTYTFVIKATDSYGAVTEKKQQYTILENHAPEKVKDIDNILLADMGMKFTLDMSEYIVDPDGEDLTFTATVSDKTILHVNPTENKMVGTGLSYGVVDVTITGTDAKGLTCDASFQVLVKDPTVPVELSSTVVTDELSIRTGETKETYISLTSQTGRKVYESTGEVGAFAPAVIDMKPFAPGIYKLVVKIETDTYTYSIIKK